MLNLALHLKIAGASLIALALLHLFFPRRFEWKRELAVLSLFTRQMFLVHCFFLCVTLLWMGAVALFFTDALLAPSPLGSVVAAGLTLFWAARLVVQWCVYDRSLWLGHRFNTVMHALFTMLWVYYVVVFGATWAMHWRAA